MCRNTETLRGHLENCKEAAIAGATFTPPKRAKRDSSKELATVALKILKFPQSSASVERSFSAVRRVHTWQRSKIGRKKLAKLVFIYVNGRKLCNRELID